MSDDLISRRAVLDNLEKHREMWDKDLTGDLYHSSEVRAVINEVPTVEERPQGEWVTQDKGAYYPCECSECHKEPLLGVYGNYDLSDFCPKCGADMRKGEAK